jgi:hypothetical protein
MISIFQFPLHGLLPDKFITQMLQQTVQSLLSLEHHDSFSRSQLDARFGPIHQTKVKLLGLIPSVVATYPVASIAEIGALYGADLPFPHFQQSSVVGIGHVHQHLWTRGQISLKKSSYSMTEVTTPTYLYC